MIFICQIFIVKKIDKNKLIHINFSLIIKKMSTVCDICKEKYEIIELVKKEQVNMNETRKELKELLKKYEEICIEKYMCNERILNTYEKNIKEVNVENENILIKNLKKEMINLSNKDVIHSLSLNSIIGDILIIKKYYLYGKKSPLKYVNNVKYEYWNNEKWNVDIYGEEIMNILSYNLKQCYISINNIKNFDEEDLLKNQVYITELSNKKNKKKLLKNIIPLII